MTYEDFFKPEDVAAYKRVKRGTMRLAKNARLVIQMMVGGTLHEKGNEYLTTENGTYRLSFSKNSDNKRGKREHERLGATCVAMGDEDELAAFFNEHEIDGEDGVAIFKQVLKGRVHDNRAIAQFAAGH